LNTPSHFLMTAALDKALPRVPIVKSAFLIGSVAPDLPLWLLSIGGILYYRFFLGWSMGDTAHLMFDELYFHHPGWIIGHNLLHAPLILGTGLALVWRSRRNIHSKSRWIFWFLMACSLHSLVDFLTHADDGPLLFFPFDWTSRFHSPVSYWDSRYHGDTFQKIEAAADLGFLIYLLLPWMVRSLHRLRQGIRGR
jgi:membrane-bound metal-dependent hydrolase YbcI (DUF457 family)